MITSTFILKNCSVIW